MRRSFLLPLMLASVAAGVLIAVASTAANTNAHASTMARRAHTNVVVAAVKRPSPLGRRKPRPAGVVAQLTQMTSIGDVPFCYEQYPRGQAGVGIFDWRKMVPVSSATANIGKEVLICIQSPRAVKLDVSSPNRHVVSRSYPAGSLTHGQGVIWPAMPSDAAGAYTFSLIERNHKIEARLEIRRSGPPPTIIAVPLRTGTKPERLLYERTGQVLGRPVGIVLAGFPPRRRVVLDLYRPHDVASDKFWYFNSVAVHTRADGTAFYSMPTNRDDPESPYLVTARGFRGLAARACFTMVSNAGPDRVDVCA